MKLNLIKPSTYKVYGSIWISHIIYMTATLIVLNGETESNLNVRIYRPVLGIWIYSMYDLYVDFLAFAIIERYAISR